MPHCVGPLPNKPSLTNSPPVPAYGMKIRTDKSEIMVDTTRWDEWGTAGGYAVL